MTEQLKLCKDCRHFIPKGDHYTERCAKKVFDLRSTSVVTGKVYGYITWEACSEMRYRDHGECGPEARLFEPRPPGFLKRLWNSLYMKGGEE